MTGLFVGGEGLRAENRDCVTVSLFRNNRFFCVFCFVLFAFWEENHFNLAIFHLSKLLHLILNKCERAGGTGWSIVFAAAKKN